MYLPLSDATDKYNVSVVARDYDFGYVGAKWLCEELGGEGNIVCLDGMAGLSSASCACRVPRMPLPNTPASM